MGFTENAAKRGLLNSNHDPNEAVMWLFSKQDDPSINLPLEEPKKAKTNKSNVDPEKISAV